MSQPAASQPQVSPEIGRLEGEWLERYVEKIFQAAKFKTGRRQRIPSQDVLHELDIVADSPAGRVLIECKDRPDINKWFLDSFLGKKVDLNAQYGAFVTSMRIEDADTRQKWHNYMTRHGITFLDGRDLERLWQKFLQHYDTNKFHEEICEELGIKKPKFCVACRFRNFVEDSYCRNCGVLLPKPCVNCGTLVDASSSFCSSCGQRSVPGPMLRPASQAYCKSCGVRLRAGASYCENCGYRVLVENKRAF